jgi:pimeloyl-ACP methyl ester carboxylesterase
MTPADFALLAADLPALRQVAVQAPVHAEGTGVVEYRESGRADAPVVVCLHGIGSNSAGYRALLSGALGVRCIAWNAPGYGGSTPLAASAPHAADYAEALAALLDALHVDRPVVLVGSSWGSVIAMVFAARHPGRVRHLLLCAPNTARGALAEADRERDMAPMLAAAETLHQGDRAAVVERLVAPDAPLEVRRDAERLRDATTPAGWRQAVQMLYTVDTPEVMRALTLPITILVGAQDRVAPRAAHADRLHAAAAQSRLIVLESVGHLPKLEAPAALVDLVAKALEP